MKNLKLAVVTAALLLTCALTCDGKKKDANLLKNGAFNDAAAWACGPDAKIVDGECRAEVEIEKYNRRWLEICRQKVTLEPDTDYRLCVSARISLDPLKHGMYIGVRFPSGRVMKDKQFVLLRDEMTPLTLEFNSGEQTELTVFCGAWIDQSAVFVVDDIKLTKVKK